MTLRPMNEAPDGVEVLVWRSGIRERRRFWWITQCAQRRYGGEHGFLPLPADASDAAVRECAVEWINGLPAEVREQAKKDIR